MSERFKKNRELREQIVDKLLYDDKGNLVVPDNPKMLSAINQFMSANDKIDIHQDRMATDNNNAAMDREVAVAIARGTSGTSLRTRHDDAPATGTGPVALGREPAIAIDQGTIAPVGGEINIDDVNRLGRAATKGTDPGSEDGD